MNENNNVKFDNLITPYDRRNIDNWAVLVGDLEDNSGITEHHRAGKKRYYQLKLKIKRLSGYYDIIPVSIPEEVLNELALSGGFSKHIYIEAQIRSFNEIDKKNKNHVRVFAYATAAKFISDTEFNEIQYPYINYVSVRSYLCKNPNCRITPTNKRITDLMLAVNRVYNKADYIPAIAWGSDADVCAGLNTRACVDIVGRFQSREYIKKIDTENNIVGISYELSIGSITIVDDFTEEQFCY